MNTNSNFSTNKLANSTPNSTLSTTIKYRKETTAPSISIANSIQELAQKEVQTQSHLANLHAQYRSHNNLSNISYNYLLNTNNEKPIKRTNMNLSKEEFESKELKTKIGPSIPKLFQFPPNASSNGPNTTSNGFKASPTLVSSHLSSMENNPILNQSIGAKSLLNLHHTNAPTSTLTVPNATSTTLPLSTSFTPPTNNSGTTSITNANKFNKGKSVSFKTAFVSYPNLSKLENFAYSRNLNRQKSFADYYASLYEHKLHARSDNDTQRTDLNNNQISKNNHISHKNRKILRDRLVCSSLQVADLNDYKSFMSDYECQTISRKSSDLGDNLDENNFDKLNELNDLDDIGEETSDLDDVTNTTTTSNKINHINNNLNKRPHTSPKILILKLSKNKRI